jgi:hypothetical protein
MVVRYYFIFFLFSFFPLFLNIPQASSRQTHPHPHITRQAHPHITPHPAAALIPRPHPAAAVLIQASPAMGHCCRTALPHASSSTRPSSIRATPSSLRAKRAHFSRAPPSFSPAHLPQSPARARRCEAAVAAKISSAPLSGPAPPPPPRCGDEF